MKTAILTFLFVVSISNFSLSQFEKFANPVSGTELFTNQYPLQAHPIGFFKQGLNPSLSYEVSAVITWNLNISSPSEFVMMNLFSNGIPVTTNLKLYPAGNGAIITTEISWVVNPDGSGNIFLESMFGKSSVGGAPLRVYSVLYSIQQVQL